MGKNRNANAGHAMERNVDRILGTKRFWANSGEAIDNESERFVVQAKTVQRMSLAELSRLAEKADEDGKLRGKIGLVAIKLRAGKGRKTSTLLVLRAEEP